MYVDIELPYIRSDRTVKAIFDDLDLLTRFTNLILPDPLSGPTTFLPNNLQNNRGRLFEADLRLGDAKTQVWIEFQRKHRVDTVNRTSVYSSVQLSGQLKRGQLDYKNIKKSVTITICDQKINKDKEENYFRIENIGHICNIYFEVDRFLLAYACLQPENLSPQEQLFLLLSAPETYVTLIDEKKIENPDKLVLDVLQSYKIFQLAYLETSIMKRKIESLDFSNESQKGVNEISQCAFQYLRAHPFASKDTFLRIYSCLLSPKALDDIYDENSMKGKLLKISKGVHTLHDNSLDDQVEIHYRTLIKQKSNNSESNVETAISLCRNNCSDKKIQMITGLSSRDVQLIRQMWHQCHNSIKPAKNILKACSVVLSRCREKEEVVLPEKIYKENSVNKTVDTPKPVRKRKPLTVVNR